MNNLNRYLNLVSKFRKFDVARSALNIKKALKSFKGIGNMPDDYLELEIKWYDSIAKGSPDYSIYNHDYFIAEVWLCWQIYSKKYLASIDNPKALPTGSIRKNMGTVRAIVDLGCGMDYTTAKLKQMFPDANVFGTNIEDTF